MKKILLASTVVVVVAFFLLQFREPEQSSPPPEFNIAEACDGPCNVIVVLSDTLGAKHMSAYGYELETTPFIDEFFSEQSIRYNYAYSPSNWTLPSIASMMRGKHASEIKIGELANNESTLIERLTKNGITVGAVLKGEKDWPGNLIVASIRNLFTNEQVVAALNYEAHSEMFNRGNIWLEERSKIEDEQFFLFIHDTTPHDPYNPGKPYSEMFDSSTEEVHPTLDHFITGIEDDFSDEELIQLRIQYDQDVRRFDDFFKEFVKNIPQSVIDTSIIILVSDHGEAFGEHGFYWHSKTNYDQETHIPFLVRVPGIRTKEINRPVSMVGFTPTILDWMGIPFSDSEFSEGSLTSDTGAHVRTEYGVFPIMNLISTHSFNSYSGVELVSEEDRQKFIFSSLNNVSLRDDSYKVMVSKRNPLKDSTIENIKTEAYLYKSDPSETNNIALTVEAITSEITKLIDAAKSLLK